MAATVVQSPLLSSSAVCTQARVRAILPDVRYTSLRSLKAVSPSESIPIVAPSMLAVGMPGPPEESTNYTNCTNYTNKPELTQEKRWPFL